jgi:bacteriocin resistance YdeI/OmpD-like protein/uncharacterized protein DUF1905
VRPQRFTITVPTLPRGTMRLRVPFDPDRTWTAKPRHHVHGTVNGARIRTTLEPRDGGWEFTLGPLWLRDCRVEPGQTVEVVLEPEGPQRADLTGDVAAALDASPAAAAFFDGLAQFYRRGYLRWIDSTKRSPQVRAERIAKMIELLEAGVKDYRSAP